MRRPKRPASQARRGVMALLLLLVVSAFFIVRQRAVVSAPSPSVGPGKSLALSLFPPARLSAQQSPSMQGRFALESISRGADYSFVPPPEIPVMPMGLSGTNDGTGLWIKVVGGTGVRTFTLAPGRHELAFGDYTLVTNITDPALRMDGTGISIQWFRKGSPVPLPRDQAPFPILASMQRGVSPGESQPIYQVLPRHWDTLYQVRAQPKRQDGADAGRAVSLACYPCGEDTLFVQLPAGYSQATAAFDITLTDSHKPRPNHAWWHLTDLPKMQAMPVHGPTPTRWSLNGVTLEADAREAADLWGWKTFGDSPPFSASMTSFNVDAHGWTGVPTLRCRMRVLAPAPRPGEQWEVQVRDARPQWAPAARNAADPFWLSRLRMLPGNLPIRPPDPELPPPSRNALDFTCGVAYPGQQRYLQVQADVLRYAVSSEPVTFTNADLAQNPATHQRYLVWRQAQSRQTASGILLTTLNARQAVAQDPADVVIPADREFPQSSFEVFWPFYRSLHPPGGPSGGVEMRLAWHLPAMLDTPAARQSRTPAQLSWLGVAAPLRVLSGPQAARTWLGSALPGVPAPPLRPLGSPFGSGRRLRPPTPLDGLRHANFQPLALMIAGAGGRPLPSHLDKVTVLVRTRIPIEHHSYTLLVPVLSGKPPFPA